MLSGSLTPVSLPPSAPEEGWILPWCKSTWSCCLTAQAGSGLVPLAAESASHQCGDRSMEGTAPRTPVLGKRVHGEGPAPSCSVSIPSLPSLCVLRHSSSSQAGCCSPWHGHTGNESTALSSPSSPRHPWHLVPQLQCP